MDISGIVLILFLQLGFNQGEIIPQTVFENCCTLGDAWAESNPTCKGYDPSRAFVTEADKDLCNWTIEICCMRRHRATWCEAGKKAARAHRECQRMPANGGEAHKDCCDGCKLGLAVASRKGSCFFDGFSFSQPWDEAFYTCCYHEKSNSNIDTDLTARNRCLSSNPCEQRCTDTGEALVCSCDRGYRLSRNRFSCGDIDECSEGKDRCDKDTETCLNAPGAYQCILNEDNSNTNSNSHSRCPAGYNFNQTSKTCDDFDECSLASKCDSRTEMCVNTVGSFKCLARGPVSGVKCPPGFKNAPSGGCQDVDECSEGRHACDSERDVCLNSYGAYQCQAKSETVCPAGYKWDDDSQKCQDVDECVENLHGCEIDLEICRNTAGGYHCEKDTNCAQGWIYDTVESKCIDLDECTSSDQNNCQLSAGEVCVNTLGSFSCAQRRSSISCQSGLKFDLDRNRCVDVDECAQSPFTCLPSETCVNTMGSYDCIRLGGRQQCPVGYRYNHDSRSCEDVNECQINIHKCEPSQRCDNTIGSFLCVRVTDCGTGYTLNAQIGKCEDDDECTLNPNLCGPNFVCRNTDGSFRCDRSQCGPDERLLDDGLCHSLAHCSSGMELDNQGRCQDINECLSNPCRTNQRCINTPGSFRCQNKLLCAAGQDLNELGDRCVDVDECAKGIHSCGHNQICRNREGGYTCECPVGFSPNNNRICEDVDECVRFRGQICSINSDCQNTQGSYLCNCKSGFVKSGNGQNCADVDECADTPHLCQHECINIWGSYQCACRPGFNLAPDNRTCQDTDECALYKDKGNLCIGFCVNEPGSFSCSCPDGYRLAADERTCQDINECEEQDICNGEHQLCINTRGGYKCNNITCPPGYQREKGHKSRCKRINMDCRGANAADCLKDPITVSYNYLTMPSEMPIPPSGHLDLFTMRGPRYSFSNVQFNMELTEARAVHNVKKAEKDDFHIRRTAFNEAMISMVKSLKGPQEIQLDLNMKMYHSGQFGGTAVAKLFIYVSRHTF